MGWVVELKTGCMKTSTAGLGPTTSTPGPSTSTPSRLSPCEPVEKVVKVQVPWYTHRLSKLNNTWGFHEFAHCELNFTMRELRNSFKESQPPNFKTGGLGILMQPNLYEVWVCIEMHYCSNHPTDKFFCWVLDGCLMRQKPRTEVASDHYVHHLRIRLHLPRITMRISSLWSTRKS